jgi:DNA replication protein DnaC
MVDDLGKERLTPGACAVMHELIDERVNHYRPTVITTRYTGPTLVRRFAEIQTSESAWIDSHRLLECKSDESECNMDSRKTHLSCTRDRLQLHCIPWRLLKGRKRFRIHRLR